MRGTVRDENMRGTVWDEKMKNFHREKESIKESDGHSRITIYNI